MKKLINTVINSLKTPFGGRATDGPGEILPTERLGGLAECTSVNYVPKNSIDPLSKSTTSNRSSIRRKVLVDGIHTQSGYSVDQEAFKFFAPAAMIQKQEERMNKGKNIGNPLKELLNEEKSIITRCASSYCTRVLASPRSSGKYYKCICGCITDRDTGREYGRSTGEIKHDNYENKLDNEIGNIAVPVLKNSGKKHDNGKARMILLAPKGIEEEANVMSFGASKYGDYNWRKGIHLSRYISASLRHIFAVVRGELNDPESGLPHLAHAKANLGMAIQTLEDYPELNDLYKKESK
jgi:Domain of unknown function (DUF5664)